MTFAGERSRALRGAAGALAAAVGLTLGLAACSADPPGPEAASKALAAALSSGKFTSAPLAPADASTAASQWAAAYKGLDPWKPTVAVASSTVDAKDKDAATAVLRFTWDVDASDQDWTYETHARLTRGDDDLWRASWSPTLLAPDLSPAEELHVKRTTAPRAEVLGAGGTPIVQPRPVNRIGIDKTHLTDPAAQAASAQALATRLEMDPAAYAAKVAAAGAKAFVEAIVVRDGDPGYDLGELGEIAGVNIVPDTIPLAPTRSFARPILGTVGDATAEIIDRSDGAIAAGDLTGLSGLERQYDAQLRGFPGLTIDASSPDGAAVRELYKQEPVPGTPLQTTLDLNLQQAAENVLTGVVPIEGVQPASAIVAIRPSTGEVLAAASGAGGKNLSTATLGQFAPGSTFKVASALALLRSGLTPDSPVTCPETVTVDGRAFQNFPGYPADKLGTVPLRTAFANSCNTAFISARDSATQDALIDAAGSLGLDPDASLGFPAFLGAVPGDSDGTDHAASMIGQGRVLASPLGMATVAASVAKGSTVVPHLVVPADGAAAPEPSETETATATPTGRPAVPLTADEAATLQSLMRSVVTEGGAPFLQDVPGGDVAAKTGTAQFGDAGNLKNHVWMIATQGDLAVAVFVDEGEYGSTTAGPLLKAFLEAAQPQG
ncbi:penicillin-binding transpeptidase domain-containing protein [Cellulomonas sp. URHD0024]|uniref:penicillin-binding transpeptidase domain-containing protein n=1 Tax=Cellulomonas sp. URHD0024 TaxID=1302620 RepID=UPI00041ED0D4|nr:penicillin-binding transpeptidase domain-containing protein [Cellulomonas sp. URHD0024]